MSYASEAGAKGRPARLRLRILFPRTRGTRFAFISRTNGALITGTGPSCRSSTQGLAVRPTGGVSTAIRKGQVRASVGPL